MLFSPFPKSCVTAALWKTTLMRKQWWPGRRKDWGWRKMCTICVLNTSFCRWWKENVDICFRHFTEICKQPKNESFDYNTQLTFFASRRNETTARSIFLQSQSGKAGTRVGEYFLGGFFFTTRNSAVQTRISISTHRKAAISRGTMQTYRKNDLAIVQKRTGR